MLMWKAIKDTSVKSVSKNFNTTSGYRNIGPKSMIYLPCLTQRNPSKSALCAIKYWVAVASSSCISGCILVSQQMNCINRYVKFLNMYISNVDDLYYCSCCVQCDIPEDIYKSLTLCPPVILFKFSPTWKCPSVM